MRVYNETQESLLGVIDTKGVVLLLISTALAASESEWSGIFAVSHVGDAGIFFQLFELLFSV